MSSFSFRLSLVVLLGFVAAAALTAQGAAPPAPVFAKSRFDKGVTDADTTFKVQQLGRYSIQAQSSQINAIELVDRMAGTLDSDTGEKGLSRVDLFLEAGEYKLRVHKRADDVLNLQAIPFTTINAGSDGTFDVPSLSDGQEWKSNLSDMQMAAWWVRVDSEDHDFNVEAMGRSLWGMMLMKDGIWLDASSSVQRNYEMSTGRPLNYFERDKMPEPGMYLLVCFGGPKNQWGDSSLSEPFFIRKGIPYLGQMGSLSVKIGEFGIEHLLLSGSARQVQVEVPKAAAYRFWTAGYNPDGSRLDAASQANMDIKSQSLRATLPGATGNNRQWFVIKGPPGETVKVRFYPSAGAGNQAEMRYPDTGPWISTVLGSLDSDDQGPFSGLGINAVTNSARTRTDTSLTRTRALALGGNDSVHLKINNFGSTAYILNVSEAGNYVVSEKDAKVSAAYSFRPLEDMIKNAPGQPAKVVGGQSISLLAKTYFVSVDPLKQGILEFAIGKSGAALNSPFETAEPGFSFTSNVGSNLETQRFLVTARGQAAFGAVSRKLPLDLTEPISITVGAGEQIDIPIQAKSALKFFSTETLGNAVLDGAAAVNGKDMAIGVHGLSISNKGNVPQTYVFYSRPQNDTQDFKGPLKLDPATLYPSFKLGLDNWQDFDRNQGSVYSLIVDRAGPYRVETTGRLSMAIEVRSPLRPSLFSARTNTNGGNAVVSAYLREGTYLVKVSALGRSKGRAGLTLVQPPILTGDGIVPDGLSRTEVEAQALVGTKITVEKDGNYLFESLGLGRNFQFRFEDSEGWPIGQPIQTGSFQPHLSPGSYRFISYPDSVATRRILRATRIPDQTPVADPTALVLNGTVKKTWMERPDRGEDKLTLDLAAPIVASFSLTSGMEYRILDAKGVLVTAGKGGKSDSLTLPMGTLQFLFKSTEVDNAKQYQVSLSTNYLTLVTPGSINATVSDVPVGIGERGFYEIWSYGRTEIEAALYDESGTKLVAKSERIPGDWNFRIVALLEPGRYRLRTSDPSASDAVLVSTSSNSDAAGSTDNAEAEGDDSGGNGDYGDDGGDGGDGEYVDEGDSGDGNGEDAPAVIQQAVAKLSAPTNGPVGISMLRRDEKTLPDAASRFEIPVKLDTAIARFKFKTSDAAVYRFAPDKDISTFVSVLKDGRILASGAAPLYLPMQAGNYELQFRLNSPSGSDLVLRGDKVSVKDVTISQQNPSSDLSLSDDDIIALGNSDGMSFSIQGDSDFLYSPGADSSFEAGASGDALNTLSGKAWLMKVRDGSLAKFSVSQAKLGEGSVLSFDAASVRHFVPVRVPNNSVALVQASGTKNPAGLGVGTKIKWLSTQDESRTSFLGLGSGDSVLSVWNPRPTEGSQRFSLKSSNYPLTQGTPLSAGKANEGKPGPGQAVSFALPARAQTISLKLQKGLIAFTLPAQNLGVLSALDESVSGTLGANGGSLVIVNTTGAEAQYEFQIAAAGPVVTVSEARGLETMAVGTGSYSVTLQSAPGKTVWIYGADARLFSDDDGLVYDTRQVRIGNETWSALPSGNGRIELSPRGGPVKVWVSTLDNALKDFWGKDISAGSTKIDTGDFNLGQKSESWSFSLAADAVVRLQADGAGLAAIVDKDGNFVSATIDPKNPALMKALPKGDYKILTRPVEAQTRSGWLHFSILDARTLDSEGRGISAMASDTDIKLYKFTVKENSRIGVGVSGEAENLLMTLYDSSFTSVGAGTLLIRDLKAGAYYLTVRSLWGTQRFTPIVYGINGNRLDIPDDVLKTYAPQQ